MAPQLAKLASMHGDRVLVLKVNVDREKDLARKAGVRSIPDTRLLHAGRELSREVGGLSYAKLEKMVLAQVKRLPPSKPTGSAPRPRFTPTPSQAGGAVPSPSKKVAQASDSKKESSGQGSQQGSIVPMKDDWLPPGVTPR